MYFEQFYLSCLSQASYMLASDGVAAVVDPQRDLGIYLEEAARHGFAIRHVIETHLHADFVSGHAELARVCGATVHVGARAKAVYPHHPVVEGDEIHLGKCTLRFLETPGHTPEGVSILVTDRERSEKPFAVLTGDTLFVGEVGRPDLSAEHTPEQLASMLFDSLHGKLLALPEDTQVFPAHGAGSLCGRNLSPERSSTIGREKKLNYALQVRTREDFVNLLTNNMPERPAYFLQDAEINRQGAGALADWPPLPGLSAAGVLAAQKAGALLLDTRPADQFAQGHVPGSVQIGLSGQFATWAGILVGLDQEVIIIAENRERLKESRMRLARVGIERVTGYLENGVGGWVRAGLPTEQFEEASPEDMHLRIRESSAGLQIVDVRRPAEWDTGHLESARLLTLSSLASRAATLDPRRPIAIYCKSGYRGAIAASLLQRAGLRHVINMAGGLDAWKTAKLPVVVPTT